MITPVRAMLTGVFAAGIAVSLGGCSGVPQACPAIGFVHTATLVVSEADPAALRLCAGGNCATSTDIQPPGPFSVTRQADDSWSFRSFASPPPSLDAEALDSAGVVTATTTVKLHWKRVGGSAQCGGPNAAHATLIFN
jgi:hypothetical protein